MHRANNLWVFALLLILLFPASSALASQSEQIIPHVVDGAGIIRTKIDIGNMSSTVPITRMKIYFYRPDGSPWTVSTSLGTSNEFMIFLGRNHSMRLETLALSEGLASGYAVIRSTEFNAGESTDLRVAVSVFYEVLSGRNIIDAVSVPNGYPTVHWMVPAEYDLARNLYSGLALVNLGSSNNDVTLQLWASAPPYEADASNGGSVTITLKPGEKMAKFLHEPNLFPQKTFFKGILVGRSQHPVAVVALLQTPAALGPQYSTLAAEYRDALHTEGFVYLADDQKLDADIPQAPYVMLDDSGSLDLHYRLVSSTVRKLRLLNGARLAALGPRSLNELNNLTLEQLKALSYAEDELDISDVSGNMVPGFTFALQTSLGHYAKLRVARIIEYGTTKDLALQVFVYR